MAEKDENQTDNDHVPGWKRLLFTPEYIEKHKLELKEKKNTPPSTSTTTALVTNVATAQPFIPSTGLINLDMEAKVMKLLEKLNEPGADFFEVMTSVDSTLTKDKVSQTAQRYIDKLKDMIQDETGKKTDQKNSLITEKSQKRESLKQESDELETKIKDLQTQLAAKKSSLSSIDGEYDPKISAIDQNIEAGKNAVKKVTDMISSTLTLFLQSF
jgi:vacuolar-type H+-ATPase subunit I/STV1